MEESMVLLKKKLHEAIESHRDWFQAYEAVCRVIVRFCRFKRGNKCINIMAVNRPVISEAKIFKEGGVMIYFTS